ncbi:hypothetical protein ACVINY_004218 [Sinorhizobium meliloti]|uniref:Uncharacterized protein n=1 Tax=Rhizobium meliloti TaxID=382 RepID=I2E1N6_RHIML|nr:hypothetical protein [Sinorhizobium meliloti]AFJ91404.1 hypothetical protein pHRC017_0273 [Sinorhizobium meliloti]
MEELRDAQVPGAELDRVWQGYDQRFADHQRQIDEVKQAQRSVYSQRLKENQQRLERKIATLAATDGSSGERRIAAVKCGTLLYAVLAFALRKREIYSRL